MKVFLKKNSHLIFLSSIIVLAAIMRFYGINTQSMWIDELITMQEVDPLIPWSKMFEFISIADPHPPLYFILERIASTIYGHNPAVVRGLNAVLGTLSVLFIYHLGKEILNRKLGYIAAILLCVNYYSLFYSQEARDYALALCTSILASLFFIKLLKRPTYKQALLYSLFSLLLLYTHYFGLFIVGAQGLLALTFMLSKSIQKQDYRYYFVTVGAIIIGYTPWMPSFFNQLGTTSFWIPPIPENFSTSYFFEYFGNAVILEPLLILILLFYCWQVFAHSSAPESKTIIGHPLHLSFAVIFFSIFFTLYIPYLRSVWVVPMLLARYTIILLPAYIVAIAYGIVLIKNSHLRMYLLVAIVLLSFTHLIFNKRFYSSETITKTQFRELSQFMKEVGGAYPLIESGSTIWPHGYYLDKFNYHLPKFWGIDKVDSVLFSPYKRYQVDGFWLVGALPDDGYRPTPEIQAALDSQFTLVQNKTFFQAWAQLYVRKTGSWNSIFISPFDFTQTVYRHNFDAVAWLENELETKPISLKSGKYKMLIEQSGDLVESVAPQISVYAEDNKIGEFVCSEYPFYYEKELLLNLESSATIKFKFTIDNPVENRIALIRFIRLIPIPD